MAGHVPSAIGAGKVNQTQVSRPARFEGMGIVVTATRQHVICTLDNNKSALSSANGLVLLGAMITIHARRRAAGQILNPTMLARADNNDPGALRGFRRPAPQGRHGDVCPPGPRIGVGPGRRAGDRRQGPRVHVLVHTHDHA